jgi:serine beta-lactamase-like protein LACTB
MFRQIPNLERRKSLRSLCFLLAAFLLAISSVAAAAQDKTFSPEKRAQIEKAVSAFMTANSVPGVSVAVVQNGQPVWSGGFGMADLEDSAPATSSTLYRLGSISKPITAVAILQLYERGKLDLDAPVQKYCPAFPQKDSPSSWGQLHSDFSGGSRSTVLWNIFLYSSLA